MLRKRENGIALIAVLGFTLAMMIVISSFIFIGLSEINMVRRQNNSTRAFYLAEAGLEDAIFKLKNDASYRDDPTALNGSLETGSYSAVVSKNNDIYTIISTGTVGNVKRTVREDVTLTPDWPSAFDYAIYGNSGELEIKEGVTITGDVFQNGDVELEAFATITGYLDVTGAIEAGDGATYNSRPLPDPLPTFPALNTAYYDDQIAIAAGSGSGDQAYGNLDLGGGTIYVSGSLQINQNGSITGPGTVVVANYIELQGGVTMGGGVTIISGMEIEMQQNVVVNANSVLYAAEKIEFQESGIIMDNSAMITPGEIEFKESGVFSGIMYAGGKIEIKENSTITGSVISGIGMEVKQGVNITYDASQFPGGIPIGIPSTGKMDADVSKWEEI